MPSAPIFTDLHWRAMGANQNCCSIKVTKTLLRQGHTDRAVSSRFSFRFPQCVSLRDGLNTRSTCRFGALMTPVPGEHPRSDLMNIALQQACHGGATCPNPCSTVHVSNAIRWPSVGARAAKMQRCHRRGEKNGGGLRCATLNELYRSELSDMSKNKPTAGP